MGAILALAGVRQTAILEFGPMGTANYGDMMLSAYGCDENPLHFATHMTDTQIAIGDFSVLEQAIDSIREHHAPRAIFVVPSALAEITGSDIEFVCEELSTEKCLVIALPPLGIGKDESFGVAAAFDCLSVLAGAQRASETNATEALAGAREAKTQGAATASVAGAREPAMAAALQEPQSPEPITGPTTSSVVFRTIIPRGQMWLKSLERCVRFSEPNLCVSCRGGVPPNYWLKWETQLLTW